MIMCYSCPIFSPLYAPPSCTLPPTSIPSPLVHVRGCTYKFFGSSISYTIFILPLSIFYLPFILFIPCTFYPILPLPFPADNPPCDLHFYDSVPILVICLVFILGSLVDSSEFVVILVFIFLIFFFFLGKSL